MAKDLYKSMTDRVARRLGAIVFEKVDGQLTAKFSHRIRAKSETSPAQAAVRLRFVRATAYAKTAMLDPAARQVYAETKRPPYIAAITDWFNPPKVEAIAVDEYHGSPGNRIVVIARDDAKVVSVHIAIRRASDASLIETGPATLNGGHWEYLTTELVDHGESVVIEVTAKDLPANTGTRSETVTINRED